MTNDTTADSPRIWSLIAPIDRSDDALPLGNGLLGGLLRGAGGQIVLSLDRADLADLRKPPCQQRPQWSWAAYTSTATSAGQACSR